MRRDTAGPGPRASVQEASSPDAGYWAALEHMGERRTTEISDVEEGRIETALAMIPPEVATVLDVGCGDGRILARLPRRHTGIGVDYSYHSLRGFRGPGIRADSAQLPFRDASFDLVMCCEVLEHLPARLFTATLRELERIARRHILVSVPYRENLGLHMTRCQRCRHVFHAWGHLRRFSNRRLNRMLLGYRVASTRYSGPRPVYHNGLILYLNQRLGSRWAEFDDTTRCPICGNTSFTRRRRNLITIACGVINLLTSRMVPASNKNWVFKLYSRSG